RDQLFAMLGADAAVQSSRYTSSGVTANFLNQAPSFIRGRASLGLVPVATSSSGAVDDRQGSEANWSWPLDGASPAVEPAAPAVKSLQIEQAIDVVLARVDPVDEQPLPAASTLSAASVESVFAAEASADAPSVQAAVNDYPSADAESGGVGPWWESWDSCA